MRVAESQSLKVAKDSPPPLCDFETLRLCDFETPA